jgi:hypothetical protein
VGQLFEIVWVEHCDQDLCLAGEMLVIVIKICVGLVRRLIVLRTLFTMVLAFHFRVVFFRRNSDLVTTLSLKASFKNFYVSESLPWRTQTWILLRKFKCNNGGN